ncbi:hypothetical protein HD597_006821 [Nonomuraea thailandensis]|uniref:Uncharacterized protein n=1 Tax=Nonomuraea thailandensis TaxID=1188745 RepID=A0A9X2K7I0_9ACTN|nr:hypothetical protein [Nonomuraea thailandensis]MCP2359801.1 hypothetical protein [Nonomuraea thailandensis]
MSHTPEPSQDSHLALFDDLTTEQQQEAGPQSTRRSGSRRVRAVRWTGLAPTSIYLYQHLDDRLTTALEEDGRGPQEAWELAINAYCDALQPPIKTEFPEPIKKADLALPRDPSQMPGTPRAYPVAPLATVRLKRNTRARLAAACRQEAMGGMAVLNDAMEAYLDERDLVNVDEDDSE